MENEEIVNNASPIEPKSEKKALLGRIFSWASFALLIIGGLILSSLVINKLGYSGFAVYSVAACAIAFFAIDAVMSATVKKLILPYVESQDEEGEAKFLSAFSRITLIAGAISLVICLILGFCSGFIFKGLTATELESLKIVFFIVGGYSFLAFAMMGMNGVMVAHKETMMPKLLDLVGVFLYIATSILATLLGLGIHGLMTALIVSGALFFIAKLLYIKLKLKVKGHPFQKVEKGFVPSVWKSVAWPLTFFICSRLAFAIAPLILGIVSNSSNIAYFGAVAFIEFCFYALESCLIELYLLKVLKIKEGGNSEEQLERLAIKIGKINLVIIGFVVVTLISLGQEFVLWWTAAPSDFTAAHYGIILVIAYQLVNIPQLIFKCAVRPEEFKGWGIMSIIKAVIAIALSVALGFFLGAIGVCLAIFASDVVEEVALNIHYRKKLGVELKKFYKDVYLRMTPALGASLVAGFMVHFLLGGSSSIKLALGLAVIFVVYGFCVLVFASKDDKERIDAKLKKIKASVEWKKAKENLPAILVVAMVLGCVAGLFLVRVSDHFSIAGHYMFYYQSSPESQARLVEELYISIDNRVTHVIHYEAAGAPPDTANFSYSWTLVYDEEDYEKIKDTVPYASPNVFYGYTETVSDATIGLFYMNETFYSRQTFEEYGGTQKCFVKS